MRDNFTIIIGALLMWQFYATVLVALTKHWDLHQKLFHIAIIWALPLLGAIYARFALNQAERESLAKQANAANADAARRDQT